MNRTKTAGFTLIEVLVAMMMFTVISLAVLSTLIGTMHISASTQVRHATSDLARQYMEDVRALWASPVHFRDNTLPPVPTLQGTTCAASSTDPDNTPTGGTVRRRQVTLSCTGKLTVSFSLEVSRP